MRTSSLVAVAFALLSGVGACSLGFGENFSGGVTPDASGGEAGAADGSAGLDVDVSDAEDAGTDGAATAPDIVLWLRFDDGAGTTAKDSAPNHNDGTLGGSAGWTAGPRDGAVHLKALGDRVVVRPHPSLTLDGRATFAFWVRIDSGDLPWLFAFGNLRIRINTTLQATVGTDFANASHSIPFGAWHHVALTYDGGSVRFFIDGFASPTTSSTIPVGAPLVSLSAGAEIASDDGRPMTGAFDDVRVYRRVLSETDIAALAK